MPKRARGSWDLDPIEIMLTPTKGPRVPFPFVLDELEETGAHTRPMFGSTAVYIAERIVLVLRERQKGDDDDGVWVATVPEHHESLRKTLPSLRSITVFGSGETGWQVIPKTSKRFESDVLKVCALIRSGDQRIGKVPKAKRPKKAAVATAKSTTKTKGKTATKTATRTKARRK